MDAVVPVRGKDLQAEEAVLGLLLPIWHLVIGTLVLLAVIGSVGRLARRGRSRMTTGLLVTAGAIVGFAVIGVMLQGR
jgi:hypothetical protein